MLDVLDALSELLAGDLAVDEAHERPFDWQADTLYVWEESSGHRSIGTGEVREDFVVMAAVAEATGEEARGERSRATTEALYAHRARMLDVIRLSSNTGPWQDGNIEGASVPAYLRQLDQRGIAIRIAGWRIVD